jgi:uncharacterized protein
MHDQIERRFLPFVDVELRAEAEEGKAPVVKGYAAVFNRSSEDLGGFTEQIAPGAFAKALKKSDVRLLYNHDANFLLGRTSAGTLKVWEDDRGLGFSADLDPDDPDAQTIVRRIKRGDLTGTSFSFLVGRDGQEWKEEGSKIHRTIREVAEVFDVGPVTFPAYRDTKVSARTLDLAREAREAAARAGAVPIEILRRKLDLAARG